jgi:DNA repair exonuclease SbcCD ATPase subunit
MKPTFLLSLALLASGLLVSCEKPKEAEADKPKTEAVPETPMQKSEALMAKAKDQMEQLVSALEGVTDKASAETAAAKIKEISVELAKVGPQVEVLKKELSEEENATMKKSGEAMMESLMGRMQTAGEKIEANPELNAILEPALMEFGKAMMGGAPEEGN